MSLNGQELEIFRAGEHGIAGKRVFTPAELQQIAQHYSTSGHEAPIVIGHPKLNTPAFGWIKSVRAEGNSLFATPHEVAPAFDAAVEAKHYKKRSAAFDPLPDGKGWMLRHVGYLGGTPPVIKGLADATFATAEYEEGLEYSTEGDAAMAEQQQQNQEREAFLDRLMGFFKSDKPGQQPADLAAMEKRLETKFAADLKAATDALDAKDKEFADFRAAHEKSNKSASASAAVAKLKAEGKWLPAFDRMHVPELFGAIADGNTVEFEFADDKGVTQKLGTLEALTTLVGGIAKFVPRGAEFGDEQAKAAAETKVDLPEAVVSKADPGSVQFDQAIKARMKQDNIDYATAQRRLTSEGKSSASYVQASSGAV